MCSYQLLNLFNRDNPQQELLTSKKCSLSRLDNNCSHNLCCSYYFTDGYTLNNMGAIFLVKTPITLKPSEGVQMGFKGLHLYHFHLFLYSYLFSFEFIFSQI